MTDEPSVFRPGSISYIRIPATGPTRSSCFYAAVFGWTIRDDPDSPAFADGSGHVIGHFVSDQAATGDDGIRPYAETIEKAREAGGKPAIAPYAEGNLTVATITDPAGNTIGIWQQT